MKKRIFSRLMAMIMALSLLSTTGFAAVILDHDAIDSDGRLKDREDNDYNYYLEKDLELEKTLIIDGGKDVTIDLNGHSIMLNDTVKKTYDENGTLTDVQVSNSKGKTKTGNVIEIGTWAEAASLTLEDSSGKDENGNYVSAGIGTITGGKYESRWMLYGCYQYGDGSGVFVDSNSSFTMNGGNITGNEAGYGGGISMQTHNGYITNGSATMTNGNIEGNIARRAPNAFVSGEGGGVFVGRGSFTMAGGTIQNNKADSNGGGIASLGKVTISGGLVTENSAAKGAGFSAFDDGASGQGTLSVTGSGDICGNISGDETLPEILTDREYRDGNYVYTGHEGYHTPLTVPGTPATCITDGKTDGSRCKICGKALTEQTVIPAAHVVVNDEAVAPTCTEAGRTAGSHCSACSEILSGRESIPALGHDMGEWEVTTPAQPGVPGEETRTCSRCDYTETQPIEALPVPHVIDVDFPDTDTGTTITDETTPLAGIVTEAQLLDELYKHEGSPDVELVEKYASHEYAPAISWALATAIVVDDEDFDPDEAVTVALLREVLESYVAFKGIDFTVTVDGEDDELVLDLSERLNMFFAELEK